MKDEQESGESLTLSSSSFIPHAKRSWSGRRDLNSRLRPWQGRTLPLSYSRIGMPDSNDSIFLVKLRNFRFGRDFLCVRFLIAVLRRKHKKTTEGNTEIHIELMS